jgi:hypothetical protein
MYVVGRMFRLQHPNLALGSARPATDCIPAYLRYDIKLARYSLYNAFILNKTKVISIPTPFILPQFRRQHSGLVIRTNTIYFFV